MTTESLRKAIHVTNFSIDATGIKVNYLYNNNIRLLEYNVRQSCVALTKLGIADSWEVGEYENIITDDGVTMFWSDYANNVGLYQYAALLLAINYEMENSLKSPAEKMARSILFPANFKSARI